MGLANWIKYGGGLFAVVGVWYFKFRHGSNF